VWIDAERGGVPQVEIASVEHPSRERSDALWPRARPLAFGLRHAPWRASRRIEMAWATAARVAWVLLRGLSIMKSWVMPS
jgi:hypothetical protein